MKKFLSIMLVLFLLCGCSDVIDDSQNTVPPTQPTTEPTAPQLRQIPYVANYVRTGSYREDIRFPQIAVISSAEELNRYYEEYSDIYWLITPQDDSEGGFSDVCAKYDDAYFQTKSLIFVVLQEGSGSTRHNVSGIETDGEYMSVYIDSIHPEVGTCDMALWHIILEVEETVPEEHIRIIYNDKDITHQPSLAVCRGEYANMLLQIPEGWDYRVDQESMTICFWPANHTGAVKLSFWPEFGVCGTMLTEKTITLGNYQVVQGFYGDDPNWTYMVYRDLPSRYVVTYEQAEGWWDQYGQEAMQILAQASLAEGFATGSQVMELAQKTVDEHYDEATAAFDVGTGLWRVWLYDIDDPEKGKEVFFDIYGSIQS